MRNITDYLNRELAHCEELDKQFTSIPSEQKERLAMLLLDYCNSYGAVYDAELMNEHDDEPIEAVYNKLCEDRCYCTPGMIETWNYGDDSYISVPSGDEFIHLSHIGERYLCRGYAWDSGPMMIRQKEEEEKRIKERELELAEAGNNIAKQSEIHAKEANEIARQGNMLAEKANLLSQDALNEAQNTRKGVSMMIALISEITSIFREESQSTNNIAQKFQELNKYADLTSCSVDSIVTNLQNANKLRKCAGTKSTISLIIASAAALISGGNLLVSILK